MSTIYLVVGQEDEKEANFEYAKAFNNEEDALAYYESINSKFMEDGGVPCMVIHTIELINSLNAPKIIISNWAVELYRQGKMSNRLHNLLTNNRYFGNYHLDELTYQEYNRYRNTGQVTWKEFIKLRGY